MTRPRRAGLYRRGRIWWCCVWRDGRRVRESLETDDEALAARRFKQILRARERGAYLEPTERRVGLEELLDDLLVHLELRGRASTPKARSHLKAVRLELGHLRAHQLTTATVERLQAEWTRAGVAPATINRRCELLRQAYRLASRRSPRKVAEVPHIPLLPVSNARQGFVDRASFEALRRHLVDADVRDFVDWLFHSAMRPNEARQLTWDMYDRQAGTLHLAPHAAKIRRGRVLAVAGPLEAILRRRHKRRRLECPLIFHRTSKGRPGQPVLSFRKAWRAALEAAGLPLGLTPYDLRRSALRHMIRAGVDPTVAMQISGHRTRSTFDRYNIVSEQDTREAVLRTAAWLKEQPRRRNVRPLRRS